jgi:hypothetical protein
LIAEAATTAPGLATNVLSPRRLIGVKAFGRSNRGFELWLETSQFQ